nr:MAG TPA: hypothetical protein [Caudoviricetes sp.]
MVKYNCAQEKATINLQNLTTKGDCKNESY